MKFVPYGDPQRFTHRLEAFSDIVIGFSLAQLSLSLAIPHRVTDLLQRPGGFFAFAITFVIICMMWLRHHKWFEHYFVPTAPTVILNFAILGAIVLLVYALQVFLHFISRGEDFWSAFSLYLGALALVTFLFAVAYGIGVTRPRASMTDDIRVAGYVQTFRLFGATAGTLAGLLITLLLAASSTLMFAVIACIAVGAALGRYLGNLVAERVVR
ncbi:MAG: DUF1211 domain-containing protein [Candidatus Eremiobacteraeota bacterium]|nr:DUF1211 domain-containing protein [Candidatus Eremiobacteraeota bacterium]